MFGSSPIETWEGTGIIYSYARTFWVYTIFLISVGLCVGTIVVSIRAENKAETLAKEDMNKNGGDSAS